MAIFTTLATAGMAAAGGLLGLGLLLFNPGQAQQAQADANKVQPADARLPPNLPVKSAVQSTPAASDVPPEPLPETITQNPLDRLVIVRQRVRRGGYGSKVFVTLSIRNANPFPVKDVTFVCAFSRRNDPYVTQRWHTLKATIRPRHRKVFARVHVGFVNISARRARCSLVDAAPVQTAEAAPDR